MHIKRIQASVIAGLLLFMLILPQSALAAGPAISNVDWDDITSTTAIISWTTNTTSTGLVRYGTDKPPTQPSAGTGPGTTHDVTLTGLTPGVTYWFQIESTDSSGTHTDTNSDNYYHFTTLSVATYSITLDHTCGVCGELIDPEEVLCNEIIEATVAVAAAGTGKYYVCWDSKAAWDDDKATGKVGEFTATGAASRTLTFYMPEAKKGIHTVYLTDNAYAEKAKATFEVFPSVKIDSEAGPVGTEVTLNGYGFSNAQDIRVTLFQGAVKKGEEKTAKSNTVGSWTVSYTIPHTPGGGYIFKVEGKEGTVWVNWVSKYFKVTPEITATPSSGTVGQTIKVEATGFASEEEDIEVTFDGEVRKENVFADVDGSWTASIAVPIRTCGRYIIDASGKATRARDVEDVTFTLVAGIAVTPDLAYVGEKITVTGGGFAPGEKGIKVYFEGTAVTAAFTADSYGCWESSFTLPASAYGSHTVSASGETTKPAVTTTLNTKTKIEGLSPVEGAPGDSVTLTGSGFSSNKKLTVTVDGKNANLGDVRSQTNGNVNITFRVPKGSPEGKQSVVVTDEGGVTDSTDFTVTKKTLSTTPLPVSPKDSTLRSGEVTFKWQGVSGDTDYSYTLEINTSTGSGNIWSKPDIAESSYTLTEEEALHKGTYYWRVKIVDDYGNESSRSDYSSFKVSPIPTWVWVVVGLVVLVVLMVVAYRETKFKVTE